MPLKLHPPRKKGQSWIIRGSYLGRKELYRSTGTTDKKVASEILQKLKRDIESGAVSDEAPTTFNDAALSYLQAGGDHRFIDPLSNYFKGKAIAKITQGDLDSAAVALYPNGTPATRNREVYTPVSAVLRHAGLETRFNRPKGAAGKARTVWLDDDQVSALIDAATADSKRFGALLTYLFYTGCRLSEGLRLTWDDVDLGRQLAFVRKTKNGDPRTCHLPQPVVIALANLPRPSTRVFGLSKCGQLYKQWNRVCAAAGMELTERVAFHCLRHSYGAHMRRLGMDTSDLVATGAWKSKAAASVYEHCDVTRASKMSDNFLPKKRA